MAQDLVTISPIDGREVIRRPYAGPGKINATLAAACKAQAEWARVPVAQRAALVGAGVERFISDKDDIAQTITLQMGRPIRHAPSEVNGFAARARHMISSAQTALQPIEAGEGLFICREPIGVALTIAPWNYPLLTAVNSIVPALMAGNAVVLKHSDQTPLCAEAMCNAFAAAGLPAGLFSYLHANHETVQRLVRAPEIGFVSFTGSVRGGSAVEQGAAGRFIGLGLELGGNDPAYVRADAKLEHAVESLVDGAFFNAGQSCCGIQRIYVARHLHDRFVQMATELALQYVLGDPRDPETTLGPVVRASAADEIRNVIAQAVQQGAKNHLAMDMAGPSGATRSGAIVPGASGSARQGAATDGVGASRSRGDRFNSARAGTAYVAPALLTGVHHGMRVMNEECFGPVVGIMPVDSDDEAVRLMNDSPYGLTAAVYTQDRDAAIELGRRIQAGTIFMNRCDYLDPALAWTGVKNSGRGVSLSVLGYEQLTQAKSYHLRSL